MAILLFKLANVPEDEAEDIRQLLNVHEIPFNETQAGRFKIGLAAIWLLDKTDLAQAKALIEHYQNERYENAQEYKLLLQEIGFFASIVLHIQQNPLQGLVSISAIIIVLILSVLPFIVF